MRAIVLAVVLALAGCGGVVVSGPAPGARPVGPAQTAPVDVSRSASTFVAVVNRVEPVAESVCRRNAPRLDCDFLIVVDDRPGLPPNAFQTLDARGRPVIGFTLALIRDARNADELAFILGHEAAHHIAGHIPQTQQRAAEGALLGGLLATLGGFDAEGVETVSRVGATVGARRFSREFELEADAIGTVIAAQAGFDPVRGAEFFTRSPDPGDRFLGSHPPNADRIATVRRTAAQL